jgi:hypothetical protein
MAIFMIVFGLVFVAVPAAIYFASRPGANEAAEVTGAVVEVNRVESSDPDGGTTCLVNYAFKADGEMWAGRSRVSSSSYCKYQRGSEVTVRYDPASPGDNSMVDNSVGNGLFLLLFVAVGLGAAGYGVSRLVAAIRIPRQAT